MAEISIVLQDQDEARELFGPQDQYLRRLTSCTGADVVLRGNAIRIFGEPNSVEKCRSIIEEWRSILSSRGEITAGDVELTCRQQQDEQTPGDSESVSVSTGALDRQNLGVSSTTRQQRAETAAAIRGGRDRISSIQPKTEGQRRYVKAMDDNSLVFCDGPAGCGKTFLAVAQALRALRDEEVRKIVLVRPAVEAGEKLGFLPGDMVAKVNPFVRPLLDAMNDMLDFEQLRRYMSNDVIEIAPLAFMRGRTLNDTFMILDEGQNTTVTQMKMFLTRMGVNSRVVVTGDVTQNDLPNGTQSGLVDGIRRLSSIGGVAIARLTGQDIVRHRLVRQIVSAYEAEDSGSDAG
jgi:phosphate starvation-inducible PhoH-like protein